MSWGVFAGAFAAREHPPFWIPRPRGALDRPKPPKKSVPFPQADASHPPGGRGRGGGGSASCCAGHGRLPSPQATCW